MRVGKLRHLASIESYTEAPDGFGEVVKSWTKFSDIWCSIKPINGKEKYVSAEKHATATHEVMSRFIDGVTPRMRLVDGTRVFGIISSLNVNEESKMMQLIVEEKVDD